MMEHPLLTYPVLETIPHLQNMDLIEVKSLHRFLLEAGHELEAALRAEEDWACTHLPNYPPRPDALAFQVKGDPGNLRQRFLRAIRINPNSKLPLYLHLLPGQDAGCRERMPPEDVTILERRDESEYPHYVRLHEGEMARPLEVLASGSDEPDYGLDVGLFTDNQTEWGLEYAFGAQPFCNPSLKYSTQAPFHMGFYHEGRIISTVAPFLKISNVEYRIHLYKTLSRYAFEAGQYYWAWRFMGWALHYIQDLSVPYHASALPRENIANMLWMNLKSLFGFISALKKSTQIVSNCHASMERFLWQILRQAYMDAETDHPLLIALSSPVARIPYSDTFPRDVIAKESAGLARKIDFYMSLYLPNVLVHDSSIEAVDTLELKHIVSLTMKTKGKAAVESMNMLMAERLRALSMHTRSFIYHVLQYP